MFMTADNSYGPPIFHGLPKSEMKDQAPMPCPDTGPITVLYQTPIFGDGTRRQVNPAELE